VNEQSIEEAQMLWIERQLTSLSRQTYALQQQTAGLFDQFEDSQAEDLFGSIYGRIYGQSGASGCIKITIYGNGCAVNTPISGATVTISNTLGGGALWVGVTNTAGVVTVCLNIVAGLDILVTATGHSDTLLSISWPPAGNIAMYMGSPADYLCWLGCGGIDFTARTITDQYGAMTLSPPNVSFGSLPLYASHQSTNVGTTSTNCFAFLTSGKFPVGYQLILYDPPIATATILGSGTQASPYYCSALTINHAGGPYASPPMWFCLLSNGYGPDAFGTFTLDMNGYVNGYTIAQPGARWSPFGNPLISSVNVPQPEISFRLRAFYLILSGCNRLASPGAGGYPAVSLDNAVSNPVNAPSGTFLTSITSNPTTVCSPFSATFSYPGSLIFPTGSNNVVIT
jgi:hypothetical protein